MVNVNTDIIENLYFSRLSTEYSDYLQDLHKQDQFYEYKYSKETMKQILTDFHKNCCLRLKNLKDKHRRELALLSRLKQETGERGETNTLTGSVKRSLFGFTARNSIVRYVNGVIPWLSIVFISASALLQKVLYARGFKGHNIPPKHLRWPVRGILPSKMGRYDRPLFQFSFLRYLPYIKNREFSL